MQADKRSNDLAELFTTFRVFNVDVTRSLRPGLIRSDSLREDASNLASVLISLVQDQEVYPDCLADARAMIPGLQGIEFEDYGSAAAPTLAVN